LSKYVILDLLFLIDQYLLKKKSSPSSKLASTERMGTFFLDNATPDFLFIRPSRNPIDAKGLQNMWPSGDLVLESAEITTVDKFELSGSKAAMCVSL